MNVEASENDFITFINEIARVLGLITICETLTVKYQNINWNKYVNILEDEALRLLDERIAANKRAER